ncbi:MarR family winged helix-turn-helix transcriptional regulator [Robertkochia solimangrovi]|uniref:MarR family winged helix-turn-helix transcriptional regulator n=1 Tax=Robertkochia solimangrovi TaxID=2213046 RepID=UPI00117C6509|nr:helix-turn-helix domain-containing protein [Robertkochia solimangrovi]TRZ43568.1 MarR family transcriptional regulator [Robertkochia solimangrovi]
MENDFLYEMEYPGLTGRLKRLSDLFIYQTKQFYRDHDLDIEPNWHPIFELLKKHERLTITEIATYLHFTHPAIVKLIDKMKAHGYIKSIRDKTDKRKFQLELSEKARSKMPLLETYWAAGNLALEQMLEFDDSLLQQMKVLESNMSSREFNRRMEDNLKN